MKRKHKGRKDRGTVTVFLTLILVPCIIFTCAFGDVSRVELSRSQAEAAGDLALYSLLSHYDENLKEWYGLVASCQDIDSFYETTKKYFIGMFDANGIEDTAKSSLAAYLSAAQNGDFSNFLQLEGLESVKVEPVKDGGMGGNPALIEDGIVEFMKYRGPVVLVENIIERFQSMKDSGGLDGLTDVDENEPIVEAKKEYAEAEGDMMSDVLHTYLAIRNYVDYRSSNGVPVLGKFQNEYPEDLDKIFGDFVRMTETITEYYAATSGIKNIAERDDAYGYFPVYDLPDTNHLNNEADAIRYVRNNYTYTMNDIGAEKEEDEESGETYYSMTQTNLDLLLGNLDENKKSVADAAQRVVDACQNIDTPVPNGNVNDAVYCMRIQNAVKTSDLNAMHNGGKALMQLYAKLILARWCDFGSDTANQVCGQKIQNAMDDIEKLQRDYLSYKTNPSTPFERLASNYKKIADSTVKQVKNFQCQFRSEFLDESVPIGTFLKKVKDYLGPLVAHLDTQIKNIDTILNGGSLRYGGREYHAVSLNTLKSEIIRYSTARDRWGNAANSSSTDYAAKEQAEYAGVEGENDLPAALYENGAEAVEVLRTRLTNIKNDMIALKTALESCSYGGYKLYDLDRTRAIQVVKGVAPNTVNPTQANYISLYLDQNVAAAKTYHDKLMVKSTYTPPTTVSGESGNEPDLYADPPALFQFMVEAFSPLEQLDDAAKKADEAKKENEKNKEEAKKNADNSKGFDRGFLNDLGIDPIEVSGDNRFSAKTAVTGLIGAIDRLLGGNFDEFRDEIYVCEYIMEMFSYSSYNNEGQYKLSSEPLSYSDYDKSAGQFKDQDLVNRWKEEKATVITDNKSLTNQMINSKNNRSNLAEVEYVLFGKATNEENLKNAYGNIFAIRETLNLVSGFANFYSGSNSTASAINGIAVSLAGATMGVIPVPVTKVVLIGILSTMETAQDMNRLKAGLPVVIYKSEEDWVYSLPNDAKDISSIFEGDFGQNHTDTNGVFYSDYLFLFVVIACNDYGLYSDMLLRVGDLIEGNMNQEKGEGESAFDLESAQCYFQLTGNVNVKPLFLDIPLVTNFSGENVNNVLEAKGWCSYSLDIIRGYS